MASHEPKDNHRPPLGPTAIRWSLFGLAALLLSLGTNLFRPTVRGLQVSSTIVSTSADYREQIRANDALEKENAFLRTQEGKQWAVRRYMGMVKPGEQLGRTVEETPPPPKPLTKGERVRAWIAQRDLCSSRCLRRLGETISCYLGFRPLDRSPQDRNQPPTDLSKTKSKPTGSAQEVDKKTS